MKFRPVALTSAELSIRARARACLGSLPAPRRPALGMTGGHEPSFSAVLGAADLVGLAIPREFGGHGGTSVERFLVTEELLAAGAPITAHWGSDRQIGPNLVRYGTPEQRRELIPGIVRGEIFFSLGMSEPDAGSDLAAVRTSATRTEGGWLVTGTKIWTSYADRNRYFMVLCRTERSEDRHEGLSQLMLDLHAPGVTVRPIVCLDPHHHFHEVVMDQVFVPDTMVLGEINQGWQQVTAELTLERAGPDRYMTTVPLLLAYIERTGDTDAHTNEVVGSLVSRLWGIRHLSLSNSRALDEGEHPSVEAALVKDLGSTFEQESVEALRLLGETELDLDSSTEFESLLAEATLAAPSYTIRGGTVEILRSVAAKGLHPVGGRSYLGEEGLQDIVERMLTDHGGREEREAAEVSGLNGALWDELAKTGVPWVGIDESAGGVGGSLVDACAAVRLTAYHAGAVPLADSALLGAWLLAGAGLPLPSGPAVAADGGPDAHLAIAGPEHARVLHGTLRRVASARHAERLVCLVADGPDWLVVSIPRDLVTVDQGQNLAGEPRDLVTVDGLPISSAGVAPAPAGIDPDAVRRRGALARAVQIAGACQAATDLAIRYANDRVQFGRPIARFQAVAHHLVRAAAESALAGNTAQVMVAISDEGQAAIGVAAAKVVAGRAARTVAAATHQIHGAIGMTREYDLQLHTRRLWSWADEWGGERYWARELGRRVLGPGTDAWSLLTLGPDPV